MDWFAAIHSVPNDILEPELRKEMLYLLPKDLVSLIYEYVCLVGSEKIDDVPVVVMDIGTNVSKGGFDGDDYPKATFTSCYGYPRHKGLLRELGGAYHYFGDAAEKRIPRAPDFCYKYPVERGVWTNWDGVERLWHNIFYNELRLAPEEGRVLLGISPLSSKREIEKSMEILFETFNVIGAYFSMTAVLSLFASRQITGTVIESGDGATHIVPIYEGYAIRNAITIFPLAGRDVTNFMEKTLTQRGYDFSQVNRLNLFQTIKEEVCYVARDFKEEMKKDKMTLARSYKLPNDQTITIENERFLVPEMLFQPNLVDHSCYGIHKFTCDSIQKCDVTRHKELFGNIVLGGGNTMFEGFAERLQKEVKATISESLSTRVVALPQRKYSAFLGGSILASLSTFPQMCVRKEEYDEWGPTIAHQKFL